MLTLSAEQVPDGWTRTTLREQLALCRNGLVCRQDYDPSKGVAVTRIETISDGEINWTRVGHTSPDEVNPSYLLKRGDILLSHINSVKHIGKVARKTDDRALIHGMNLMSLRCAETLDPGFGFAVMSSKRTKTYMERRAKKAVNQASVNRQDIFDLRILLPPLHEQRAIAGVLDAIDEAKERTEAVIAATERLRDSLLHELLTRGVPGWHREWKEVAGVGTVPACWEVVRLGEVGKVKGGKRLPKGTAYADRNTGLPYIRVVDFSRRSVDLHDIRFLYPETHRAISSYTICSEDVYISIAGTIGFVGTVPDLLDGANLTENAAKIVIKDRGRLSPYFLMSYLDFSAGQSQIARRVNILGQPKLALERIRTIQLPTPMLAEQAVISAVLTGIDQAINRASEERKGLQSLKLAAADALLTGRLRTSAY